MTTPPSSKQQFLLDILKTLIGSSSNTLLYASVLGTAALALDAGAGAIVTGVGITVFGDLLKRLAGGEKIAEADLRRQVEVAIQQSNVAEAVNQNQRVLAQMFRETQMLKAALDRHEYVILRQLSDQLKSFEELKEALREDLALINDQLDVLVEGQQTQAQSQQEVLDLLTEMRELLKVVAPPRIKPVRGKLFLSYARADDEPFVKRLYDTLTAQDFDVWWDRARMPNRGLSFLQEIQNAITECDRLLLVVGPRAVQSLYVRAEWEYAASICKPVLPLLRQGDYSLLPDEIRATDAPDFRNDAAYDDRLAYLLRQLEDAPAKSGKLVGVPQLPTQFQPRPAIFKEIKDTILTYARKPTALTSAPRKEGMQGMGGIGKSVLAAALARDCDIRRAFPDGVLWVTVSQTPNLTRLQSILCRALGDTQQIFADEQEGLARLSEKLEEKQCLLILDDVWELNHAHAFEATGPRSAILITTRDESLIDNLGAVKHKIDKLSEDEAVTLMVRWLIEVDTTPEYDELQQLEQLAEKRKALPAEAYRVARECGYLPLALILVAALARDGVAWDTLLTELQNRNLVYLNSPNGNIIASLELSITALAREKPVYAQHYRELGIFPEDVAIPEATLMTLWLYTNGLTPAEAERLLVTLSRKALIRLDGQPKTRRATLHDIQYDYLRTALQNIEAVHGELLEAYRKQCPGGWATGPNDGYFFQHLAYHLYHAGKKEELYRLLTGSPAWLEAKFMACGGDAAYVADLELVIQNVADPLTPEAVFILTSLYAARQVVNARVDIYTDTDLQTLVWLKRDNEALAHARLRVAPVDQVQGILAVYQTLRERQISVPTLLLEAREITYHIVSASEQAEVLRDIAAALAQAGQIQEGLSAARGIDSIEEASRRAEALRAIAVALAQAGDAQTGAVFQEGLNAARGIEDASSRAGALRAIAVALAQAGQIQEGLSLARSIENAYSRAWALRDIAATLARAGDAQAGVVFQEGVSAARGIDSIEDAYRRAEARWAITAALAQAGQIQEGLSLARSIGDATFRASALRAIAVALAQAGDAQAGVVFQEGLSVARSIGDATFRAGALRAIAVALAQAGDAQTGAVFQEGLSAARGIEDASSRAGALRAIAVALAQAGDAQTGAVFQEGLSAARSIENASSRAGTLRDIAAALAQAGQIRDGLSAARGIEEVSSRAGALRAIAAALAQAGDAQAEAVFQEELSVARSIEEVSSRAGALRAIAVALAQAGQIQEGLSLARGIEEVSSRGEALRAIVAALAQAGQIQEGLSLARGIEEASSRGEALRAIVAALVQAGQIQEGLSVARSIEEVSSRAGALRATAATLAQAGDAQTGAVFQEGLSVARSIEEAFSRGEALRAIAVALAQAGQIQEGLSVAHSIESAYSWARVLPDIAATLAQAGQIQEGLSVARSIEEVSSRAETLRAIVAALAQVGQIQEGLSVARSIEEVSSRAEALRAIVAALAQAGQIQEGLSVARGIEEVFSRAEALRAIAAALAQAGQIQEGLSVARGIEEVSSRGEALRAIVAALAQAGDAQAGAILQEGLSLARSIEDATFRTEMLWDIAVAMARQGQWATALAILGMCKPHEFVQFLAEWTSDLETLKPGLAVAVLHEVLQILAWVRPAWGETASLLVPGGQ